uniref:Uncharacterized protein n=1 Tax=Anguilla anguilla TaxID=7936 RepID=A0A0E9UNI0_ANGAN
MHHFICTPQIIQTHVLRKASADSIIAASGILANVFICPHHISCTSNVASPAPSQKIFLNIENHPLFYAL